VFKLQRAGRDRVVRERAKLDSSYLGGEENNGQAKRFNNDFIGAKHARGMEVCMFAA
jgi:hypothetical protein